MKIEKLLYTELVRRIVTNCFFCVLEAHLLTYLLIPGCTACCSVKQQK